MEALSVVANPSTLSFSHAMWNAAGTVLRECGCRVREHDLYAERFNPVQSIGEAGNTVSSDALVETHCNELAAADLILVFHPNWWGQPPAILKGWIDRVFRLGVAYGYAPGVGYEGVPTGLLRARQALVFNTSNTPEEREKAAFGDPLAGLWKRCVFSLCGVNTVARHNYAPVAGSTSAQREQWLQEVREVVEHAAIDPQ
jgi:NAD(P)H dehydrogenase (quinone)